MDRAGIEGVLRALSEDFSRDVSNTGTKTKDYLNRLAEGSVIVSSLRDMKPRDQAALATSMIPGVGDAIGVNADIQDMSENWGDRHWADNAAAIGAAAMGALPFVPSRSQLKGAKETIKAYHGSPHDFDEFSMDSIGTGEGAQAYGHGLYFAESEGVAKGYKDALTEPYLAVGGQRADAIYTNEIRERFSDIYDEALSDDAIREWMDFKLDGFEDPQAAEDLPEIIERFKRGEEGSFDFGDLESMFIDPDEVYELFDEQQKLDSVFSNLSQANNLDDLPHVVGNFSAEEMAAYEKYVAPRLEMVEPKGSMYQVDIDASPDELLDWDKPLSEQGEKVQEAMAAFSDDKRLLGMTDSSVRDKYTGADLYDAFARGTSGQISVSNSTGRGTVSGDAAPDVLRNAGIKGIKYKDGFSRGAEGGTSNYVIFDDRLISISKKYGVAIPVAATMLAKVTGEDSESLYKEDI